MSGNERSTRNLRDTTPDKPGPGQLHHCPPFSLLTQVCWCETDASPTNSSTLLTGLVSVQRNHKTNHTEMSLGNCFLPRHLGSNFALTSRSSFFRRACKPSISLSNWSIWIFKLSMFVCKDRKGQEWHETNPVAMIPLLKEKRWVAHQTRRIEVDSALLCDNVNWSHKTPVQIGLKNHKLLELTQTAEV